MCVAVWFTSMVVLCKIYQKAGSDACFTLLLTKYPKDSRAWLGAGHSSALPLGAPLLTHL